VLTYTEPPERMAHSQRFKVSTDIDAVLADLPATGTPAPNAEGDVEHWGSATGVHRFVDAPGDSETVRWHFVESGDPANPTVVLLHGMPDSWWQWHYVLEALSDRYHCVAIDLKGYGQSDKRTGDYRQAGVARQLEALLDYIGVTRFALVTHDRGTPLGDHLVKNAGERVSGYARGQQHLWHLHPSLHPTQDLFLSPDAPGLLGDARRFVATAYTWLSDRSVAKTDLLRTIEEFSHPGIATAVPRYYHSSSFRQEWVDRRTDLIAGWKAPVLLLQGRGDPLQPYEFYEGREIRELLPAGSRLHLFDTGHFWPFEAPEETVAVLGDFLDHTNG
jgi:pimeloyl-ACP methyl ester carboxylesterase